ncbi:hypothetical protein P1A145kb_p114 [Pectobacterium phage DU_PP_I]|nr:hypothetical protein P1A145kb_p114 [Pectobacterium phage DU_PP_I]ATS93831.1 hypothetical protein P12B145kb_p115 [Pectobacterium phage DU_PP_IV]
MWISSIQNIEGIHMELGDKISIGLVLLGGAMLLLGVIGKIIMFVIQICGGYNG